MKARKNFSFMFLFMTVLVLLVSACGNQSTPGTGSQPKPKPSDLTVQQVLQKSADAMKNLKSSHIELKSNSSTQAAQVSTKPSDKATPVATNVNISMTGSGDQQGTDQQQLNLTINSAQQNTKLGEIVKGDKVYIQNAQGKWYVLNKSQLTGSTTNLFSGATFDQNSLLGLIQSVKLVDHGADNLNGESLRHLTASLDKDALKQILKQNPNFKGSLGQQNIDTALSSAKTFLTVVDVWIDESKFYVHRTQVKTDIVLDTSATATKGTTPGVVNSASTSVIDLSKFDQPVTINVPANATPTDNPATAFGLPQQP
ncbi:DUF6612 family protein [Dictyobacter alpinus]|uniref:DUF6612 family protein n=1 Tax=Dictyobacter alpinus TaxID=2014873 RepID=UPI000F83D19A|nr:DUF6612 family protein [Dictyobacter alpinus]